MAQANPIDIPQNFSTTLNAAGGINNSQTTGIILTSVSNLPTDGGILALDWANPIDTSTIEYVEYTGITGNELTGVIRGVEGYSAKAHSNGCTIVGIVSRQHIKRLRDKLTGNDAVALQDPNANEILKTSYVASAVNEFTATNAATGNAPDVAATGGDTNIDMSLTPKGTGEVKTDKIKAKTANSGVRITDLVPKVSALTDGANIATNAALGNYFTVTLAGNRTMDAPTNPTNGQIITYEIKQDTTGTRTITWSSAAGGFSFGAGSAPTLSTAASKVDLQSFRYSATVGKWLDLGNKLGF